MEKWQLIHIIAEPYGDTGKHLIIESTAPQWIEYFYNEIQKVVGLDLEKMDKIRTKYEMINFNEKQGGDLWYFHYGSYSHMMGINRNFDLRWWVIKQLCAAGWEPFNLDSNEFWFRLRVPQA